MKSYLVKVEFDHLVSDEAYMRVSNSSSVEAMQAVEEEFIEKYPWAENIEINIVQEN